MTMMLRERLAWVGLLVLATALTSTAEFRSFAQTGAATDAELAAKEKERCAANLKKIYPAIEAYQTDHRDLPKWLSDLVPQYLQDANTLICPVCRRTGQTEPPPLADPNLSSSYLFEFCPLPLGKDAPNAPTRTRREWKRRQMGLVGSKVPLVRCRHHTPTLNLAFDGTIYESPAFWELSFTNRVKLEQLTAAVLFANDTGLAAAPEEEAPARRTFPARDPKTRKQLLDLSKAYNAMLSESWHGGTDNQLGGLAPGVQNLGGVDFDIRGIVQLAGKASTSTNWPTEVDGLPVRQKCARVHFLHAAGWGKPAEEGKQIGSYIIHYATNNMRLEVPIIYGQAVRDWHEWSGEAAGARDLTVVWTGENGVSRRANAKIRLFRTTWINLVPDVEIESIDFISNKANAAPFLVGITVE